jgi:hypothetical protein
MKYVTVSLIAGLFLVVGTLSIFASDATAQGFVLTGKEKAYCRLTNVVYGKDLFSGICTVKEAKTETRTLFTITMGSAEPFQFASHHDSGYQYTWEHKGEATITWGCGAKEMRCTINSEIRLGS